MYISIETEKKRELVEENEEGKEEERERGCVLRIKHLLIFSLIAGIIFVIFLYTNNGYSVLFLITPYPTSIKPWTTTPIKENKG